MKGSAAMRLFRSAAFRAFAISGSRVAKNSCSWSLTRSQGGLPSTTSKPPRAKICGNASSQWKKPWSSAMRRVVSTSAGGGGASSSRSARHAAVVGAASTTGQGSPLGQRKAAHQASATSFSRS